MSNTKLIWITPNAEKIIAYCARVSSKNQDNPNIEGLLKYCLKHNHVSIMEMASMCIEIKTTRGISSQIIRHRSFSFQEFSTRYQVIEQDLEIPNLRRQDIKNRQNSISDLDDGIIEELQNDIIEQFKKTKYLYKKLLDKGVDKECARNIMPLQSPTRIYMSGTLRSWLHFIRVRTHPSTQLECRIIAEEIKQIFIRECPILGNLI